MHINNLISYLIQMGAVDVSVKFVFWTGHW